jgi:tetratricopeptide (TPR) repeat protein
MTNRIPSNPGTGVRLAGWVLPLAVLVVGSILTVFAYRPALTGGFVFDDRPNIVVAPGIKWEALSIESLQGLRDGALLPRRWVANGTLAMNHLAGGLDPYGYHVVNIVIHLLVGLVLTWVAWLYLRSVRTDGDSRTLGVAAALAAVLFLLHPLNSQAVAYVVQRMTSLAALFNLLALGLYWTGRAREPGERAWPWYVGVVAMWALALGSKENSALLPLVVGTYEACFRRSEWRSWWDDLGPQGRRAVVGAAAVAALVGVGFLFAYAGGTPIRWTHQWATRDFNGIERVLTQLRVQILYLGLLLWPAPSRLNLDHHFEVSRTILDPATALAALFWIVALIGVVSLAIRRPRFGFPLLAYLEWHLVEAGPVNLELVFEHRMYLPMAMLALLVAVALVEVREHLRGPATLAALVAVVPLTLGTWQRAQLWGDSLALHRDTVAKSPEKFRPWYSLGTYLGSNGMIAEAREPLERALALRRDFAPTHNQLGNVAYLMNRRDEALEYYRTAAGLDPPHVEATYNLGRLLDELGRLDEAVRYYQRFIEVATPEYAQQVVRARQRIALAGAGG